jgi:hypothetical protein
LIPERCSSKAGIFAVFIPFAASKVQFQSSKFVIVITWAVERISHLLRDRDPANCLAAGSKAQRQQFVSSHAYSHQPQICMSIGSIFSAHWPHWSAFGFPFHELKAIAGSWEPQTHAIPLLVSMELHQPRLRAPMTYDDAKHVYWVFQQ